MTRASLVVALALAFASTAQAKQRKTRLLLVEPQTADLAPATLTAIDDFLGGALRDQGFDVVEKGDIAAALGAQRERELLGCKDGHCLAEIGGAMGVDCIVRTSVTLLEDSSLVSLVLSDADGHALSQTRQVVRSHTASAILQSLETQVPKLVEPVRERFALTANQSSTRLPDASSTLTKPHGESQVSRVPAYVLFTLTAAFAVGAGYMAYKTVSDDHALPVNYLESQAKTVRTEAHVADALWGGALVCGGIGTYLYFSASASSGGGGEIGLRGNF